ncbi:MAG TPA: hypothetical protein VE961_12970, partial [Pyrinomonadaceae bacterium]|nr:hypothetical protein [Pyrinomonadaceae bacterium]
MVQSRHTQLTIYGCHRRWLSVLTTLLLTVTNVSIARAQSSAAVQSPSASDPNKYAVIISGASGEPAYAKQFQQWTEALHIALTGRFGFPTNRVRVLTEKPAGAAPAATADEVKKLFASLRTELNSDSELFLFLIGHGS